MIYQTDIEAVISDQLSRFTNAEPSLTREILPTLPDLQNHALVISGIRRCGKSTLLRQLLASRSSRDARASGDSLFLNFDDPRLAAFALPDFQALDAIIAAKSVRSLFLDELQLVEGWEMYVRQKLDAGLRVTVTGSNASLLSRELGTRLTGRHISKELFPFSYREFLSFKTLPAGIESLRAYLSGGGFPEYLKTGNADMLSEMFTDILTRDIAIRHGVRDLLSLKKLALYLVSNAAGLVTASRLRQVIGIGHTATVLEYFSHLSDAYLIEFMPRFSYSPKVQNVNPRKLYVIDPGMIKVASLSSTSAADNNNGRLLENLVYWELRRTGAELYYLNENGSECDFVVFRNGKPVQVMQVCWELTPQNRDRERRGLIEAMDFFNIPDALILTADQRDTLHENGRRIPILPAWDFFK